MHFAPAGTLSSSLSQSERHAASAVAVIGGTEPHFPSGVPGVAAAVSAVAGAAADVLAGAVVAVGAGVVSVVVVVVVVVVAVDDGAAVAPVEDGSLGVALFELPPHAATTRRPKERMRFRMAHLVLQNLATIEVPP